ncbi:MAG: M20/M25/M40 family metallo-hydrolase [Bdellovibrionota bacterium]|nr:MAG: M20/M25/M40 family metallo-hydrolase [Bdellovibrionota bacterium]
MSHDEFSSMALSFLQKLLQFDTSNPPGDEQEAIQWIAAELDKARISYEIVGLEESRPNLIATLTDPGERAIALLSSHVDVVPVEEPSSWKVPPFSAREADGCLWGRGALDMKYKTAYDLALFCHFKKHYGKLPLKAAFLADEEADATHGSQFVVSEHRALVDADVVLNEVGGFNLPIAGKTFFPIQVGEKGSFHYRLHAHGTPGHASIPYGTSSIQALARALTCIEDNFFGYSLCDAAKQFLDKIAQSVEQPAKQLFTALGNPASAEQALSLIDDAQLRAQIRAMICNTIAATRISGGFKLNVLPEAAFCDLDCRLSPATSSADFTALLQQFFERALEIGGHRELAAQLQIECVRGTPGYEVSSTHPLITQIADRTQSAWEELGVFGRSVPMLLPASSDNAHYAAAGMLPVGCAPLFFPPDFPGFALAHSVNERIPVDGFKRGLAVYSRIVAALLGMP